MISPVTFRLPQAPASQAAKAEPDPWADFAFLEGSWTGEGDSPKHGHGSGVLEFTEEADGKALYRTNSVDYDDGFKHRDWTKVYRDPKTAKVEADYQDNEGFVVHYDSVTADAQKAVFVSSPSASSPGFRFTYQGDSPSQI